MKLFRILLRAYWPGAETNESRPRHRVGRDGLSHIYSREASSTGGVEKSSFHLLGFTNGETAACGTEPHTSAVSLEA